MTIEEAKLALQDTLQSISWPPDEAEAKRIADQVQNVAWATVEDALNSHGTA